MNKNQLLIDKADCQSQINYAKEAIMDGGDPYTNMQIIDLNKKLIEEIDKRLDQE
jgi:hypothetical protein